MKKANEDKRPHQAEACPASEEAVLRMKSHFVETLRILGVYSPAFDTLIETTCQLKVLRDMAYTDVYDGKITIEEVSREGDIRKHVNPALRVYLEISKELRASLSELTMTIRTSSIAEGDKIDEINRLLKELAIKYEDTRKGRAKSAKG